MPQYDTDPAILEERAYAMAMEQVLIEWEPGYGPTPDRFLLQDIREGIRTLLLREFPDIEGPRLAELMDEALTDVGYPLEEI